MPNDEYTPNSGTSMAAPVVSGVAALVWAYHPELTASELKAILVESGTDLRSNRVFYPGDDKKTKFKKLSRSGKVVNAYNALELAVQRSAK
jgi:subtilisin family serine protease